MSVFKPQSPNVINSPKNLARILRGIPSKPDIGAILNQEAKLNVVNSSNNTLSYYSIVPDKKPVVQKHTLSPEPTFKSIHKFPDSKEAQFMLDKLTGPKYNQREKNALVDIRKQKGKLYLLSDLYHEFTKDIEKKSAEELLARKKGNRDEDEETRLVEDLEKWEREKVAKKSESPKNVLKKPSVPPIVVNHQVTSTEIKGSTQPLKTPSRSTFRENSVEFSTKKETMKENAAEGLSEYTPEPVSIVKFEEKEDGDVDSKEKSIEKVEVGHGNESLQELKDDIVGISGQDDNNNNKTHLENTKGMTLHQKTEYYRELNEKKERKFEIKIKESEQIIKEKEEFVLNLRRDNDILEQKIRQLTKQLEAVEKAQEESKKQILHPRAGRKFVKKGPENNIQMLALELDDENSPENIKKRELKQNIDIIKNKLEENENALIATENVQKEHKQKIRRLNSAKVDFYKKVLMQGMDAREEGLIWLIMNIIEAGEQVVIADFPVFLDYKSRKFLINKAKALRELKELKLIEKATIEVFKTSRDIIFGEGSRFSDLFRSPLQSFTSDASVSSPKEAGSKLYLNTSGDRLSSMQSPIHFEDYLDGPSDDLNRGNDTINSPGKRIKTDEPEKVSRMTENEEIYKKVYHEVQAKNLLRAKYTNEEVRKEPVREKKSFFVSEMPKRNRNNDEEIINDHVKLYNDNILVNNYRSRQEFLRKMHKLSLEAKTRQMRIVEETETEAIRIVTEYGNNILEKQVDLDVYLMCMFGYSEANKYLNKFGLGQKNFF